LRKRRPSGMQRRLLEIDPVPMTIFEPVCGELLILGKSVIRHTQAEA